MADSALNTRASAHSVAVTMDRLEAALKAQDIAVVARVNHAASGDKLGMTLRPTEVILFANPRLGTPLMQSNQRIGLDLPLKVLAWEDEAGKVWLGYTAPADLASPYHIGDRAEVIQR